MNMKKKITIGIFLVMLVVGVYKTVVWFQPLDYVQLNKVLFHARDEESHGYDFELYTMNPDGSDIKQLTHNQVDDLNARYSPDGKKIVFHQYGPEDASGDSKVFIYTMDIDGSNLIKLHEGTDPAWSPDGTQIAFINKFGDVAIMNSDGSEYRQVSEHIDAIYHTPNWFRTWFSTNNLVYEGGYDGRVFIEKMYLDFETRLEDDVSNPVHLRVSLDGKRLTFIKDSADDELYVGKLNSWLDPTVKFEASGLDYPVFSPDGNQIMFSYTKKDGYEFWTINRDGSNKHRVVKFDDEAFPTDWR